MKKAPVGAPQKQTHALNHGARFHYSSKRNPCPICGRTKDGSCSIHRDGQTVICHRGQTHAPPDDVRDRGDTITGHDDQIWAYAGESDRPGAAKFTLHKPLEKGTTRQKVVPIRKRARPAEPAPAPINGPVVVARLPEHLIPAPPPEHLPDGHRLHYSPTQWTEINDRGERPRHLAGDEVLYGAGNDPWPLYGHELLEHATGQWIAAAEGPKCAIWLQAGGLVAVSQPGHDHKPESITRRFRELKAAGIAGMVYLADHDDTGRRKAQQLASGAAAAGLPFIGVQAADVWPEIPIKGSIDDAPGSASDRVEAFLAAIKPPTDTDQPFRPRSDSSAKWGKRSLGFTKALRCFERCVEVLAKRERNSLRRTATLLRVVRALGLKQSISRQDLAPRILEAKDRQQGNQFTPLSASDRAAMPEQVVRWLIPSLLPANDLTIIGGRPKVGKTRLAVLIASAVAHGKSFMGFPAPEQGRPVVLVTDDQADGDSAEMLKATGLWDRKNLIWSRHFRLTENDIDALLEAIKDNPGALVVIDSLRSIGRSKQAGENDPEIGAILYDLKQAVIDAGGTLLLIHHCNKAADLVGVEALSGHNSIAGAANTVITMHYIAGDNGQLNKNAPERRLVREGRSGSGFDLVITRDSNEGFRVVTDMDVWEKQAREAKQIENLTPLQQQVLETLAATPSEWMTRRQVCDALEIEWTDRGRTGEPRRVGDALTRLVAIGQAEQQRLATEATFKFTCGSNLDPVTTVPISHTNGSQCHGPLRDNRDKAPSDEACHGCHEPPRDTETPCDDSLARLSRPSQGTYEENSQRRPLRVDGRPGWWLGQASLPEAMSRKVLCIGPDGFSHQIERHRIAGLINS